MQPTRQTLEVWGEFACFSRPELKVERFSYPVITPSAARGIFDAIYAKPAEFRWAVLAVEVLRPPTFIALRRNEVKDKANVNAVHDWMADKREPEPIWADGDRDLLGTDEKGRTQRQTMALKDVRYRLHAEIRPWPGHEASQAALEAQFRRGPSAASASTSPISAAASSRPSSRWRSRTTDRQATGRSSRIRTSASCSTTSSISPGPAPRTTAPP
jgi:CRISPR-associated protein Cas5d